MMVRYLICGMPVSQAEYDQESYRQVAMYGYMIQKCNLDKKTNVLYIDLLDYAMIYPEHVFEKRDENETDPRKQ